jgi:hypothetical protein
VSPAVADPYTPPGEASLSLAVRTLVRSKKDAAQRAAYHSSVSASLERLMGAHGKRWCGGDDCEVHTTAEGAFRVDKVQVRRARKGGIRLSSFLCDNIPEERCQPSTIPLPDDTPRMGPPPSPPSRNKPVTYLDGGYILFVMAGCGVP